MDPDKLSKLLAGVSSSGVWVCFDEFNRISLDVLSVVASMFETIFDSIKSGSDAGTYLGDIPTKVLDTSGYFITMNPGYAGRSALPDNLSALFRPVAMMKADFRAIVKIEMMSVGFKESDVLSVKIVSFYDMMDKQLSKAKHYEF
jgi:dynein heavy chain